MKVAIKTFIKVLLALGAVFVGLVAFQRWASSQTDYIEIYNDEEDEEDVIHF